MVIAAMVFEYIVVLLRKLINIMPTLMLAIREQGRILAFTQSSANVANFI